MNAADDCASRPFDGVFRRYQVAALDAFDHGLAGADRQFYLVLPPGSGKTTVGLEAARRAGRRTLVLVPNTAVQGQWADTWDTRFPNPAAPACGTDRDLAATLTVLTYQSLAVLDADTESAERRQILRDGDTEALLGLLHPNGRALVDRAAASGPWTLVLDECHHLLATWGALLRAVVRTLGADTVLIGLTATPARELTGWQRTLRDDLFGAEDFEVATPALVKEGDLAPYQELVYFTEPTPDESTWLISERTRFDDLTLALVDNRLASLSLAAWLRRRLIDRSREDGAQLSWAAFAEAEPALADAGLRFVHSGLIPLPDGASLREQHRVLPDARDWVTVLTDFCLRYLEISDDPRDADALRAIRAVLPGLGYRLTKRGVSVAVSPVDRVCALSESKVAAAVHILATEHDAMSDGLRALVLTDFETQTAQLPASLDGTSLTQESGSARLVLAAVTGSRSTAALNALLVTGRTFACAAGVAPAVIAFCADHGWPVTAHDTDRGLVEIVGASGFTPRVWVGLATRFFADGGARVLIGTRALLGEGWDCPRVNVTIDLTSATTASAITQMRGRSLRLDPADPVKLADNWSVCCLTSEHPRGDADYLRLIRKQDGYFAPAADGVIEVGITHCDAALSPFGAPTTEQAQRVTAESLARVAGRTQARANWHLGEPYAGVEVAAVRVRSERALGAVPAGLPRSANLVTATAHSGLHRPAAASLGGLVASGAGGALSGVAAGPLVGSAVGGGLLLAGAAAIGVLASVAGSKMHDAPTALEQLAAAIADGLHAAGGADAGAEQLTTSLTPDGWIRCELGGVPHDQSVRFATALDEILSPLADPRYLLGRRVLTPPTGRLGRISYAGRAWLGLPLPGIVAWHALPRWFATSRHKRDCLVAAWENRIGPARVLDAHTPDGQTVLELFRAQNPLSVFTQLRTTWR